MNSGMGYAVAPIDSATVAVGLEYYLGRNYERYQQMEFLNQYQIRRMDPQNVPVDCVRGWIETEFLLPEEKKQLLEIMQHHGKNLYALERCFPQLADSSLVGYSGSQVQWCEANEFNLWGHFIEQKLLYSKNPKHIRDYTAEAPFTSGLDRASPGRLGMWLGWQIVRSYIKEHPNTTLPQLMAMDDAQAMLADSRYKPTR